MQNYYQRASLDYDRGFKQYELTNHLGNVLATVSDRKFAVPSDTSSLIDHYEPDIVTAQDYYPFGMLSRVSLPNSGRTYKFGFNGKMNDDEVKGGLGNQQDYGMRIYDPRVGRFLSVDPITKDYPELTPYQFASNRPIDGIDQDGLEWSRARPNNGNLIARDQLTVQKGIDPNSFKINPHGKWSYNPITYPGGSTGVAPFPKNSSTLQQWEQPKSGYWAEQQKIVNERNWLDAGYNADGSKPPLMRLEDNKTWNSFADNLALPLLEGYFYLGGAAQYRSLFKGAVSFLDKEGFAALKNTGVIDPRVLRFSQSNIASTFKNGDEIQSLINALKSGEQISIQPIRIVETDGMVFSLDNRRLYAFQQAGVDIPYVKLDHIPKRELGKFSTTNNGVSIKVRK